MSGRWFTIARFALYAVVLATLGARLVGRGEHGHGETRVDGSTSQMWRAAASFDGSHPRWVGIEWTAHCSNGSTVGPQRTIYLPSELNPRGTSIAGSVQAPVALGPVLATATARIAGALGPGPIAQGTFTAVAHIHNGRRVTCRSGTVRWAASQPAD